MSAVEGHVVAVLDLVSYLGLERVRYRIGHGEGRTVFIPYGAEIAVKLEVVQDDEERLGHAVHRHELQLCPGARYRFHPRIHECLECLQRSGAARGERQFP